MTHPDTVFAAFVDANPVPDGEALDLEIPSVELFTSLGRGTMTDLERRLQSAPDPTAPRRARWRPAAVVAAAFVAIALVMGGVWIATTGEPEPAVQPEPELDVGAEAVESATAWMGALITGDVDAVVELSDPSQQGPADVRLYEFHAARAAVGGPMDRVETCELALSVGSMLTVDCEVTALDPVAQAVGINRLTWPFTYSDEGVRWLPAEGGDLGLVNAAYAEYLQAFDPEGYAAACSPVAYEPGTVVQNRGLALTGECGQIIAPIAADVAQWVRDGRPEPVDVGSEAAAAAELWIDLLREGDVDGVVALMASTQQDDDDRRMYEYHAAFASAGRPTVESLGCEATSVTDTRVQVECQVIVTDPVAEAVGAARLVFPFLSVGGELSWQPATGGDLSLVNAAYAEYLQAFHPDEYATACSPTAYPPGEVVSDRGIALTGECGELQVGLSDDVAQWVIDGRPAP